MKNLFYISLSIFLGVFLYSSCKEKKTYCEENPSECENIKDVKNYFLFKVGSWWVYEEETTLAKDSVYVTEYLHNPSNYDFNSRVFSSYNQYYYHFFPNYSGGSSACNPDGDISTSCIRVRKSKYKSGDFVGETDCFLYLFKKGMYSYTYAANEQQEGNKIIVSEIYPSYVLGNLSFGLTVKISEEYTLIENQQSTNHFYSKNVGLIRKELLDSNEVWNLVSYHIEP